MAASTEELKSRWSPDLTSIANALLERGGEPASTFGTIEGRADFRGLVIEAFLKSSLSNLDLSSSSLAGFGQFSVASVWNCRFDSAALEGNLGKTFQQCSFAGASLKGAVIRGTFENCSFIGAALSGARASEVAFRRCDFTGANFTRALLLHSTWEDCRFDGARFRNGSLAKGRFIGPAPTEEQLGNTIL